MHQWGEIPEIEETLAQDMWEAVRRIADEEISTKSPPFSMIDFTGKVPREDEVPHYLDDNSSVNSVRSKHTMKTLPSYMGEYKPKSIILKAPAMWKSTGNVRDTANLHALMSAPVTCTLPLTDVLKVRPDLWEGVAECLTKGGNWNKRLTIGDTQNPETLVSGTKIQVPINKLGSKAENNGGNTTLPVLINKIKSVAILDSGA